MDIGGRIDNTLVVLPTYFFFLLSDLCPLAHPAHALESRSLQNAGPSQVPFEILQEAKKSRRRG